MITRTGDGTRTYDVDALGRIVKIYDRSSAQTLTIDYDALGRPVKLDDGVTANFLNSFGSDLVLEGPFGGGPTREYSNHPLLGRIATHVSGESFQHLYDAKQNNITTLDHAGTVRDLWRFDAFGFPTNHTTGTPSGIEPVFGGMRYLNFPGTTFGSPPPNWPSGLYLAMFRVMDSYNGTWLSPDPLGYLDSPNRNAYVAQNPVSFVDPSGLNAGANRSNLVPVRQLLGFPNGTGVE